MSRRFTNPQLTDRERIFMHIIQGLGWTQGNKLAARDPWSSEPYRRDDGFDVHFAKWDEPVAGDLVLACSGQISEWKLSWMVRLSPDDYGVSVVRAVGSRALCNYGNESWYPIRGLRSDQVLEGDRYKFYEKVHKAFWKGGKDCYRHGGLEFTSSLDPAEQAMESSGTAKIWIRQKFGMETVPFSAEMEWSRKTTVKAILAVLVAAGYGTREFKEKKEAVNGTR